MIEFSQQGVSAYPRDAPGAGHPPAVHKPTPAAWRQKRRGREGSPSRRDEAAALLASSSSRRSCRASSPCRWRSREHGAHGADEARDHGHARGHRRSPGGWSTASSTRRGRSRRTGSCRPASSPAGGLCGPSPRRPPRPPAVGRACHALVGADDDDTLVGDPIELTAVRAGLDLRPEGAVETARGPRTAARIRRRLSSAPAGMSVVADVDGVATALVKARRRPSGRSSGRRPRGSSPRTSASPSGGCASWRWRRGAATATSSGGTTWSGT